MPAVEAGSYELAFHILPTIAEGEVATIFQGLKDIITKHGGETALEEAPARFDLAYEIVKYLEGRNRKFSSAYFGWVRFTINPAEVEAIGKAIEEDNQILRHLLVRLTKSEEAHPFMFHEALEEEKVQNIEVGEETEVEPNKEEAKAEEVEKTEESTEVNDEEKSEEAKA